MNNKSTKILSVLLGLTILLVCYFCYELNDYKNKYKLKEQELIQYEASLEFLNPVDCMVISGDGYEALCTCNMLYHNGISGCESKDKRITKRDYLLYCYIFAIRDNDAFAAEQFSEYYLNELDENNKVIDTAMIVTIIDMAKLVMKDTCKDLSGVIKYKAAMSLENIYGGSYIENFKDTILAKQYRDSSQKYLISRW